MQHRYLKNVVSLELDAPKCIGCGRCTEVCPHGVFDVDARKARILKRDGCMECGACSRNCPTEAISVRAGVGCAYAIVMGTLKGTSPDCGCGGNDGGGSGCC